MKLLVAAINPTRSRSKSDAAATLAADYLTRAAEGAVASVAPGGRVFLGDLRSLPLLESFQTSVELHRAAADLPVAELRRLVARVVTVNAK